MLQHNKLSCALKGFRPLILGRLRILQVTAWEADRSEEISGQVEGLSAPKPADGPALERLLSRAEAEMSDPEAMQRRQTIARLKMAAASAQAERNAGQRPRPDILNSTSASSVPAAEAMTRSDEGLDATRGGNPS